MVYQIIETMVLEDLYDHSCTTNTMVKLWFLYILHFLIDLIIYFLFWLFILGFYSIWFIT